MRAFLYFNTLLVWLKRGAIFLLFWASGFFFFGAAEGRYYFLLFSAILESLVTPLHFILFPIKKKKCQISRTILQSNLFFKPPPSLSHYNTRATSFPLLVLCTLIRVAAVGTIHLNQAMCNALSELRSIRVSEPGRGVEAKKVFGCSEHLLLRKPLRETSKAWVSEAEAANSTPKRVIGCGPRLYTSRKKAPPPEPTPPQKAVSEEYLSSFVARHHYTPIQKVRGQAIADKEAEKKRQKGQVMHISEMQSSLAIQRVFTDDCREREERKKQLFKKYVTVGPKVKKFNQMEMDRANARLYKEGIEKEAETARVLRDTHCSPACSPRSLKREKWSKTLERLYPT